MSLVRWLGRSPRTIETERGPSILKGSSEDSQMRQVLIRLAPRMIDSARQAIDLVTRKIFLRRTLLQKIPDRNLERRGQFLQN